MYDRLYMTDEEAGIDAFLNALLRTYAAELNPENSGADVEYFYNGRKFLKKFFRDNVQWKPYSAEQRAKFVEDNNNLLKRLANLGD